MYKALAPMSVREQCRFEPTCSTYMMIAIRKYGLIIGITMGLNRISRCHYPNGGIDYPKLFKKGEEKHGEK
jgi:putative membrane protein insertion efficiency factor